MHLVLSALVAASFPSDPQTYNGREGRLDVAPPRVQAEVTVDGRLDEPVWVQAARLTGFSLYAPVDGRPAPDSTEVFVWYSSKAIHFGIRAYAEPGTVRAALGDRDKSYSDDYIGIFLSTVGDGRQATGRGGRANEGAPFPDFLRPPYERRGLPWEVVCR